MADAQQPYSNRRIRHRCFTAISVSFGFVHDHFSPPTSQQKGWEQLNHASWRVFSQETLNIFFKIIFLLSINWFSILKMRSLSVFVNPLYYYYIWSLTMSATVWFRCFLLKMEPEKSDLSWIRRWIWIIWISCYPHNASLRHPTWRSTGFNMRTVTVVPWCVWCARLIVSSDTADFGVVSLVNRSKSEIMAKIVVSVDAKKPKRCAHHLGISLAPYYHRHLKVSFHCSSTSYLHPQKIITSIYYAH